MRTAFLLAALTQVACATSPAYIKVGAVHVEGNAAMNSEAIVDGLVTHSPSGLFFKDYAEYDEVSVAMDRERIAAFYHQEGYFSATVGEARTRKTGKGSVEVTFTVVEGEPTHVDRFDILGLPDGVVLAPSLLILVKGDVFKQLNYLGTKDNVKSFLIRRGYAHAQVTGTVEIERDSRRAVVGLRVDAGPLVAFGEVEVKGLTWVPESAVRARVAWATGGRYDPARVVLTQARLYQLGLLASVVIDHVHEGRPAVAAMTITVREALRHEVKLGGGVALDNAQVLVRPRAGYLVKRFWDPLLVLDLEARPGIIVAGPSNTGQLAGEVSAALRRDDLFLPRLRGTLGLTLGVTELETYATRGLTARLGFDRPFFDDHLLIGFGYSLRWLDFSRVAVAIAPADRAEVGIPAPSDAAIFAPNYLLGVFEQAASLDHRDNPLDAHDGYYIELRSEVAVPIAGSQNEYLKLTPEVRGYFSPFSRLVLAARARYGITVTGNVPITQRHFSGGAASHRGFTYRRLSPMSSGAAAPVPIGGTALVETSVEARFDVLRVLNNWLGVAAFLDGGTVTLRPSDIDLGQLHYACGGGLRYNTIIGPIRFDVGYRLNRFGAGEPDPGKRLAVHITLGQAF